MPAPSTAHRVIQAFLRWVALGPGAAIYFWVLVAAHVALKVLLGLVLVFEDGYGARSMLAPPQSIVFTGGDILFCYGLCRLLDLAVPLRAQRAVFIGALPLVWFFLAANFVVHEYFKAFVNRGLLAFAGASTTELADYARAGMTRYATTYLLGLAVLFAWTAVRFSVWRAAAGRATRAWPPIITTAVAGLCLAYGNTLSAGQSGWLTRTPAYELMRSYIVPGFDDQPRATPEEAAAFVRPEPMFGHHAPDVAPPAAPKPPAGRRPNVLWFLVESLPRMHTVLAEGPNAVGLPMAAELAENGLEYTRFRTVFPATSRSFLTSHCGAWPTAGPSTVTKYMPGFRCASILDALHAVGYRTGFFTASMFTYDNLHKSAVVQGYDAVEDFNTLRGSARRNEVDAPAVEEEAVAAALTAWLDDPATREQPYFATYLLFWSHAPYRVPFNELPGDESLASRPPLERYRRTLTYVDGIMRALMADLGARGLLDDTIVILTADHGEGFALGHPNSNHAGHIYEDDVNIPFVMHFPPGWGTYGRQRSDRSGTYVDFAPTLAALLGLPSDESWVGQDLLAPAFHEGPILLFGRSSFTTNGIVDGTLKFISYPLTGQRMLFDLEVDPGEQDNLADARPDAVAAYEALATKWLRVTEERAWATHERLGKP